MPVDLLYTFPLKHDQAVQCLLDSPWTPSERDWVLERTVTNLYHPLGRPIRNSWYLEDGSYPLPRFYMKHHGLGDAGDMVALILFDFVARLRKESFNIEGYAKALRQGWLDQGLDPVTKARMS